jgi:hypothetical protein
MIVHLPQCPEAGLGQTGARPLVCSSSLVLLARFIKPWHTVTNSQNQIQDTCSSDNVCQHYYPETTR